MIYQPNSTTQTAMDTTNFEDYFALTLSNIVDYEYDTVYLKIVWIHMQSLRVHHAQRGIGGLDVVHVLYGSLQTPHHGSTVSCHLGVTHDRSRA